MKPSRSLFRRILDKIRRPKTSADPVKPSEKPPRRKTDSSFEPLEGRIAPAILVNPSTVQFTDTDGDLITIKFSKNLFKGAAASNETLDNVFKFLEEGTVRANGSATDVHELALLDLTKLTNSSKNPAEGVSISITATKQGGSNDQVNVGYIKAATSSVFGISLGKIVVDGDLGQIDAGNRDKAVGIKSLTVQSMGAFGLTTQLASGSPSLESNVTSSIGKLTVLGDFVDATLRVVNGSVSSNTPGKIGALVIGGDLKTSTGNTSGDAGLISTAGGIESIRVDDIFGGAGTNSAKISANGKIGNILIEGNLQGGAGKDSGQIVGSQGIGKISMDTLWAGAGEASGRIVTSGNIGAITLNEIFAHHNFANGDAGKTAGSISATGNIASLTVAGDISGGKGDNSGAVSIGGVLGKLTVGGQIIGGAGLSSGHVIAGSAIGNVVVEGETPDAIAGVEVTPGAEAVQEVHRLEMDNILGTGAQFSIIFTPSGGGAQTTVLLSGKATATEIAAALNALPGIGANGVTVTADATKVEITFAAAGEQTGAFSAQVVQASLIGGAGDTSGSIISNGKIGNITLKNVSGAPNAMVGGTGSQSGAISTGGNVGAIKITGSMDGTAANAKEGAGGIVVGGNIASFAITGDLQGGGDELTGAVSADGTIGAIKVTGSLLGGAGNSSGGIFAGSKIKSALVTGSLDGGSGPRSGSIMAGLDVTKPGDLGKVTVLGALLGDGQDSASVWAGGKLVNVVIGVAGATSVDAVNGGAGANSASIVGGTGIGTVTINGNVVGGEGINSGSIQGNGLLSTIKVSGNLAGGTGDGSGSIQARDRVLTFDTLPGNLGKVIVNGGLLGNTGDGSGQIVAEGSIKSVTVGSLAGNVGNYSGGIVAGTGMAAFLNEFKTIGGIGSVTVNGVVQGNTGVSSGSIEAAARIAALTVNGHVSSSTFSTGRDFGTVTINGNVLELLLSAQGSANATSKVDLAIAKLTINGSVTDSTFLAGYDLFGNAVNGNAQIGSVKVSNNWTASNLVAGVQDVEGDGFGDADDSVIDGGSISRIASIVIGGAVTGTSEPDDHFGFVAQTIGSLKVAGAPVALTSSKDVIDLAGSPITNDTSVREVA